MNTADNENKLRTRLVRALREIERLREKTDSLEAAQGEAIAIIGIGLRLPGGVHDLDSLWALLEVQLDAVKIVPADRWNADAYYDADPDAVGKTYTREAAFLDQIDQFDPAFFNISPREAKSIDPTHRLLLEAAWEGLEHAAILPATLTDTNTGVFVGVGSSDYQRLQSSDADAYGLTGTQMSFAAGRVAFTLGLQGPAISVDTACSSSLVGLHLACHSLRVGECQLALAAGVQVMADPQAFVQLARTHALAPDGRCKTFSANADGYGRGEGVVLLVLERLSDAQKNNRDVLAVVRGTAVNHDGASSGITAPNGTSQQRVLRAALADAHIGPDDVDFIECHGTGTKLGDPIEVQALASVYAKGRSAERPLLLGALKTNIGHLEAAAGLAGVAKVIASMRNEALPGTNHASPRNPHIEWDRMAVAVVDELRPWPHRPEAPRRAGVSGFGLSGTNAHVILEEAPAVEPQQPRPSVSGPLPLLLSGRSEAALIAQAGRLHERLARTPNLDLVDVGFSLATTRTHFEYRAAIVANDVSAATSALGELVRVGASGPIRVVHSKAAPKLGLLFTGQGSQRRGMGEGLYAGFPAFREVFDEICAQFDRLLDKPLRDVMFAAADAPDAGSIDQTAYAQPALFTLEVALFRLYATWGIKPHVLLGHSIGELAAAHVAGIFSLEDACRLVAARGQLMQALQGHGAMYSVQAEEQEVATLLVKYPGVDIAGLNGPMSTVISGDEQSAGALAAEFQARSRKVTRLVVSHAFHSHHMDPMLDAFRKVAESITYNRPTITIVSNITGDVAQPNEICSADYWVRQVRSAVRFFDCVRTLERLGVRVFAELGPHGVLAPMAAGCLSEAAQSATAVVSSLRRDASEPEDVTAALARLHCHGVNVDWGAFHAPHRPIRVSLPPYAFQRQRHWFDPVQRSRRGTERPTAGHYSLSGERVELANGVVLHALDFGPAVQSYLGDHVVYGHIVVPGAFYVAVLLAIAESHWPDQALELRNVEFIRALTFGSAADQTPLYAELLPLEGATGFSVTLFTREDGDRIERAVARISPCVDAASVAGRPKHTVGAASESDFTEFSALLHSVHIEWGPKWWWLRQIDVQGRTALARLAAREGVPPDDAPIPGGFIDNSFALLVWTRDRQGESDGTPQLPFSVGRLVWYGRHEVPAFARLTHVEGSAESTTSNIEYWDGQGEPVGHVEFYTARRAPLERFIRPQSTRNLYCTQWSEVPAAAAPDSGRWMLLGTDALGLRIRALPDLPALVAELDARAVAPELVVTVVGDHSADPLLATNHLLSFLKGWFAEERLAASKLVIITRRAIATDAHEDVLDLAHAPIWGLLRSAQSEYSDRVLSIIDLDDSPRSMEVLPAAVASQETQLSLRAGVVRTPRLAPVTQQKTLELPNTPAWRLDIPTKGSIDGLAMVEYPSASEPLPSGHVRLSPRVAGVNFRDVLNVLDMYPGDAGPLGGEGGGVITEVASDVSQFAPGDRVMGMFPRAFSNTTVADVRWLMRMPANWSFAEAATSAVVYLTAWWGLAVLGDVRPGARVLIHAAAGGVGIAALHLAKHFKAEVYATASPSKWPLLRQLGLPEDRIASSRTLEFEQKFMTASGGHGMDLVLNSLADEFLDASLRMMPNGGRFLEMGKIDLRDAATVASDHPGVRYLPYDILNIPDDEAQRVFAQLEQLFAAGVALPLPFTCWDVRNAPLAFRYMAQARHVGKVVLTIPRRLDPHGSVLITGATGALGTLVARHLVANHGARNLQLVSRRGEEAPAAAALLAELRAAGATVTLTACDVSDRAALAGVLASIPAAHPLTAVVHTAGALDDGMISALDRERLAVVFSPKVNAALHLHELTANLDLAAFVLFSSLSGVIGSPGQGSYAAANVYLDALCAHRRAIGLVGISLAWGPWAEGGMAARLSEADKARVARSGFPLLSTADGLALLDAGLARPEAVLTPVQIDTGVLAAANSLPPVLRGLVRVAARRVQTSPEPSNTLSRRLAGLADDDRSQHLLALVRNEAATVLALASAESIEADVALQEYGLDSLMAVELRNRLQTISGLRLSSTFLFDYPTSRVVAREIGHRLLADIEGAGTSSASSPTPMQASDDPADDQAIAIVAMACRLPGGVETPEDLWRMLIEERDLVTAFPSNRNWRLETLYDADPDQPGTTYSTGGGFLEHPESFDAGFFGISPREAGTIDPQQRLLLELSWEALERATIDPSTLVDSLTGVYVGVCYHDYVTLAPDAEHATDGYAALGSAASTASGRISYSLGLQGPAVSVDTACSTSLVALHLAAQALRNRECDLALAGGATVFATPEPLIFFSRLKALSPDGRCKSFSAQADGAGWAEGAAMLTLERLSDARAKGHPVLAVIRGSAINQDGRSQGFTAPNGPAQQRVILAALAAGGLSPADVDVVEAHGTGTKLGDPIEAGALHATYGRHHTSGRPLYLGSLKSNMGHMQAAAGVAGIIKMVLAMQHELLPKTLHAEVPSPFIDWDGTVQLLQESRPWSCGERPRRAAVSAFGISGTNAHVVIEEAAKYRQPEVVDVAVTPPAPIILSARDENALVAQAGRLREFLHARTDLRAIDVAHALLTTRTQFERRVCISADNLTAALDEFARSGHTAYGFTGVVAGGPPKLAMLFTGQGSQRLTMGRELYLGLTTFRTHFEEICAHFDGLLDVPLQEVVFADASSDRARLLDQTGFTQPALFALEVALFRQFEAWGVVPDILLGHSIGELAAAHVAGVLSLRDACRLVAARATLMQALRTDGAMLAITATAAEVAAILPQYPGVDIAGLNGPRATVVSGDTAPLLAIQGLFEGQGRKVRRLTVSHAFHSHHMDGMLDEFLAVAQSLVFSSPKIPIVSNVTGQLASAAELCDPAYWVRHVRGAVRFHEGVHVLESERVRVCLELGPHGVLSSMVTDCLSDDGQARIALVPAMRRDRGESETIALAVGSLYCRGFNVDWGAYFGAHARRVDDLPCYPFQRQPYWLERTDHDTADAAATGLVSMEHGLLRGVTPVGDGGGLLFTTSLSTGSAKWLVDHRVFERVVFPGAGFAELVLVAARQAWPDAESVEIDELILMAPLVLEDRVSLQVLLDEEDGAGRRAFRIYSRRSHDAVDQAPSEHASGFVGRVPAQQLVAPNWPPSHGTTVDVEALYARLRELGLDYGPAFRGLQRAWRDADGDLYAEVSLPGEDAGRFCMHPALLDAVFQVAFFATNIEQFADTRTITLPFAVAGFRLFAAGSTALRVHARKSNQTVSFDLWDPAGELVARISSLEGRSASIEQLRQAERVRNLYRMAWQPASDVRDAGLGVAQWALVGSGATVEHIVELIHGAGSSVVTFATWAELHSALVDGTSHPASIVRVWTQSGSPDAATAHMTAESGLAELRDWLVRPEFQGISLLWLTTQAVAHAPGDAISSLSIAPLWGMARVAMNEAAGRILKLLDIDQPCTLSALHDAIASSDTEFVWRNGTLHVPRLQLFQRDDAAEQLEISGTVLVSGGTGKLGAHVARHLVRRRGVEHLILTSRRGAESQNAAELAAELLGLGAATVDVVACDVADRSALESLLASIPQQRPLRAVFHAAGVLEDAIVANLGAEQLHRVLEPKLDGAWNLHTLTADLDLDQFVLFSSAAGIFGNAGQANYAAANTFLDALAHYRRERGLPGLSLAWGPWRGGGMAASLEESDLARLRRSGVRPISVAQATELLDESLASNATLLVPIDLDSQALQRLQEQGELAPILTTLVTKGLRHAASATVDVGALVDRLAAISPEQRLHLIQEVIGSEIGSILHIAHDLDPEQLLQDLGLDSLMAVELRNRLQRVTGLRLPSTLLFEHPTARELTERILAELADSLPAQVSTENEPLDSTASSIQMIRSKRDPSGGAVDQWHNILARLISDPKAHLNDALELFAAVTKLRSIHGLITDVPTARPVQLTRQRAELTVFCHPTYAPPASAFQYLQLAESMNGRASVWSSSLLGYGIGTNLPGSWQLQIQHQHAALTACASGGPVVLLAHSAGGIFSYYHAAYMEALGVAPLAVVLLDTFHNSDAPGAALLPSFIHHTTQHLVNTGSDRADHELLYEFSAFINTQQQLDGVWASDRPIVRTPTLFVQCPYVSEDVPAATNPELWRDQFVDFSLIKTTLNHFQLITDTDYTTNLIFNWLREKGLYDARNIG